MATTTTTRRRVSAAVAHAPAAAKPSALDLEMRELLELAWLHGDIRFCDSCLAIMDRADFACADCGTQPR